MPIRARFAIPVVLLATPLIGGVGCARWGGPPLEQKTADVSAPHVAGSSLEIKAHNGSVRVTPGTGDAVAVHATLRMETVERLEATTISANRQPDGTLLVTAIPPEGGWRSSEGCGFEVVTPGASGVTVSTDNGGIDVRGCAGLARLNASNGAVIVHDAGGAVEAHTSNGRVEVHGSHGAVSAKTSNGAIVVDLAPESPGPISVGTSNGSIGLTLSPAYRGTLVVSTSNGGLHLPDAGDGITIRRDGKTTATLAVGEGGGSSDARTSNGGITVTRARATPG